MKGTVVMMTIVLLLVSVKAVPQDGDFQKIPFELANGLILVEASVNGDTGSFILDTGSPMVVVNPKNISDLQISRTQSETAFRGQPVLVKHFAWAGIEREGLEALAMDMSHLEKASQRKILGVIGYEVLRKYELMFDCRNQVLLLYEPKNSWVHLQQAPLFSARFTLQDELPVITARIGKKKVRFGLDTGGTSNLMSQELLQELPATAHGALEKEQVAGFGNLPEYKDAASIYGIQIADKTFRNSRFIFTDLSHLKRLKVDSLLGMPFLCQYRFSINYRKGEIYFWPHGEEINYRRI